LKFLLYTNTCSHTHTHTHKRIKIYNMLIFHLAVKRNFQHLLHILHTSNFLWVLVDRLVDVSLFIIIVIIIVLVLVLATIWTLCWWHILLWSQVGAPFFLARAGRYMSNYDHLVFSGGWIVINLLFDSLVFNRRLRCALFWRWWSSVKPYLTLIPWLCYIFIYYLLQINFLCEQRLHYSTHFTSLSMYCVWNHGRSVRMGWTTGVQFLTGQWRDFIRLLLRPDRLLSPPSLLSDGYWGS
jgi:hypothetical protein